MLWTSFWKMLENLLPIRLFHTSDGWVFGRNWPACGYADEGTVCRKCGLKARHDSTLVDRYGNIPNAPDPCFGKLPGVTAACCGHGQEPGYISFENGVVVRFIDAEIERHEPCHAYGSVST